MAERKHIVRTTLLLPAELHAALAELAKREQRSLHKQIIYILDRYMAERERPEQPKQ